MHVKVSSNCCHLVLIDSEAQPRREVMGFQNGAKRNAELRSFEFCWWGHLSVISRITLLNDFICVALHLDVKLIN